MDNQKRIWSKSGQSSETGKRFRWELDLGNLAGRQEPAGSGTMGSNRCTGVGWRQFQGDKFPDSPPSPHICASAI